jgi:hypothetical protein
MKESSSTDCPARRAPLLLDGMPEHDLDLILTLAGGLTALVFGFKGRPRASPGADGAVFGCETHTNSSTSS